MGPAPLLSENIRWVGQITLEGERLTADDIVLNRSAVIGARLDRPGIRVSFVLVVLLLIASLMLSVTLFLQTLQFFNPDYSRFALSLVPLLALAWSAYQLRPRHHLTVLISDGSALLLASGDGNFLSMCLEAFERLWADKSRMRASLYLHAAHRSVDFGPSGSLALTDDVDEPLPPMPELPMFADGDDEPVVAYGRAPEPVDREQESSLPPVPPPPPVADLGYEEPVEVDPAPTLPPPPLPPVDEPLAGTAAEPELSIAELLGAEQQQNDEKVEEERIEPELDETPDEAQAIDDSDKLDAVTAGEDMFALDIEPEAEPEPVEPETPAEPEVPAGPVIEAPAFDAIRPKVSTLSRLLRDRPDFSELIDAVDVVDEQIEAGCQTLADAEALAGAVATLRGPLAVYPAALQVVEAIAQAGELDRFMPAEPTDA